MFRVEIVGEAAIPAPITRWVIFIVETTDCKYCLQGSIQGVTVLQYHIIIGALGATLRHSKLYNICGSVTVLSIIQR